MNVNMWVEVFFDLHCWSEGREEKLRRRFRDKVREDLKVAVVKANRCEKTLMEADNWPEPMLNGTMLFVFTLRA